ncbi:MAG: hypothetical protein RR340_00380 [Cloacibacillus sp.]
MFKRTILFLTAAVLLVAAAAVACGGQKLPDIQGWENGQIRTTELGAISGNKGTWYERSYRTIAGVPFRAIWVDGAAAKGWQPNEMSNNGGEIWGGETSTNVTVGGEKAVLEYRPVVGYSLVLVRGDGVLTLESQVATEKDLTDAAETLLKNMK